MSAYKQFTTKDIVITPFSANKGFLFQNIAAMTASNVGIEIYLGTQPPPNKLIFEPTINIAWGHSSFVSGSQNATGFVTKLNTNSIYSSAMHLYYSNFFGSESGSLIPTSSMLYGLEGMQNNPFNLENNINIGISGSNNLPIGAVESPQYYNYPSSTIQQTKAALTGETIYKNTYPTDLTQRNYITNICIPSKLYGNNIEPQSFRFTWVGSTLGLDLSVYDDGNGNLFYRDGGGNQFYCGNIIYEHGMAILTPISASVGTVGPSSQQTLAQAGSWLLYGTPGYNTFALNQTASVGFSSSVTLYEHQYKCTIRENEFGYSLNPSLLSGSQVNTPLGTNTVYKDFATGSYFSPYITTVGLYDNDKNLLAIGKLSVPTKVPMNADLEIQVSFDSN